MIRAVLEVLGLVRRYDPERTIREQRIRALLAQQVAHRLHAERRGGAR